MLFDLGCVHRLGDKIWRECKCGKRKANGWCCKNQPWEHAYCALVSRMPSPAHPLMSSSAGANAPSGVSAPAGPSGPAGVIASMSPSAPAGVPAPLDPSIHFCGNAAADGSSQQVHAQARAVELEHGVTGPGLNSSQGLTERCDRAQIPQSSIRVRCDCIWSRSRRLQHCIHDENATVSRWYSIEAFLWSLGCLWEQSISSARLLSQRDCARLAWLVGMHLQPYGGCAGLPACPSITVPACAADSLRAVASSLRAAAAGFWAAAISPRAVAGGPSASACSPRALATGPRAARDSASPYAAPATIGFIH